MTENEIGTIVIDAAIAVHRELGPGLLETVYELVLAHELHERGLDVICQVPVPIIYKGIKFDEGFRADIIVQSKVILELKSVEHILPVHRKQVQTYLRLTGCKLGYLLNFGEEVMKTGIARCVNGLEDDPSAPPYHRLNSRISPHPHNNELPSPLSPYSSNNNELNSLCASAPPREIHELNCVSPHPPKNSELNSLCASAPPREIKY